MKRTVVEVDWLLFPEDAKAVEKRLLAHPGIYRADVNPVDGLAVVEYDETRVTIEDIIHIVALCGYHCRGVVVPRHLTKAEGEKGDLHHITDGGRAEETPAEDSQGPVPINPEGQASIPDKAINEERGVHGDDSAPAHAVPGKERPEGIPKEHEEHGGMSGDIEIMAQDMLRRLLVSIPLTILILPYSVLVQELTGISPPVPFGLSADVFSFLLATPVVFYGGWMFFIDAVRALRNRILNLSVLVTISVLAAYIFSVGATFFFTAETFYEAATVLMVFILGGHWLDLRARGNASAAIRTLLELAPPMATVVRNGQPVEVLTSEVKVGDTVLIRPGDKVPVDGVVIEGESAINESMITGESLPLSKGPGDEVIGATINQVGSFTFRATKVGADTALAQIIQLVAAAQASKPPSQVLADRAAQWLTLTAIVLGPLTFAIWFFFAGQSIVFAFTLAVTVIVIACPDALGLATPMAVQVATSMAASRGILFKSATALEDASRLQAVIMDKTGTLTKGEPEVTEVMPAVGITEDELVAIAAAVERGSEHPIAKAIMQRAERLSLPSVSGFAAVPGQGAEAQVNGSAILVGNLLLMETRDVVMDGMKEKAQELASEGRTVVYVAKDGEIAGLIAVADAPRPTSQEAIRRLKERGVETIMLTGDNWATARRVAADLGIEKIFAEVLPAQKVDKVKEVQKEGKLVAMVGDGINDAPALVQSDVGIAIGAGTDVALESADVVLMRSDPLDVARVITISSATRRKMIQNLWYAAGYNIIAFPIAGGVFFPLIGLLLRPEIAAFTMSGSSVLVTINALLLGRTPVK
ncbi:MAG: copper-translocating P-type ATPase [Actinobacteria bacterium]|nr:copper-translocating P-type ATPase [Actinomycetota bacterium]